jgi:hypothetical protein
VANLHGNGKRDLIVNGFIGNRVQVFLGNGDGTFQGPQNYDVQANFLGAGGNSLIAVGDFLGHGRQDIVTSDFARVTVLSANGDGTFQSLPGTTTIDGVIYILGTGDFHNGRQDLILAHSRNEVTVMQSNGDGTFSPPIAPVFGTTTFATDVAAADFTGSGKQDLVTVDKSFAAHVLLNNGDGTFRSGAFLPVNGPPTSVLVGDFAGSGHRSVAVLGASSRTSTPHDQVSVFLGNGDGTFQGPQLFDLEDGSSLGQLVAKDFNGDGKLDLAVVHQKDGHNFAKVLLGNGDGTFQDSQPIKVADGSLYLTAADLNGDGKSDIVTTSNTGDVTVLLGNGDGTFQKPFTFQLVAGLGAVTAADFAGNGTQDLAILDRANNAVDVLMGNGDGTFQDPVAFGVGNDPEAVVTGDFFRDGRVSLAVMNRYSGSVSVLHGNGDGTFQTAVNFMVNDDANALAVGNFQGHGAIDLATPGFGNGVVSVLLNQSAVAAPPAVESIIVNDGSASRAQVTSLTVAFNTTVTLSPGAFEVQRADGSDIGLQVSTSAFGGKTVAVITFTGSDIINGSPPDGDYVLTVHKDLAHNADGLAMTQDATLNFFRAAAPAVVSTVLNDGAPQTVTSVTVTFSTTVTLGAGALDVRRADGSDLGLSVSTSVVGGQTVAVVTFADSELVNGSLPDGSYTLIVHKDLVHDVHDQAMDQDATFNFFRQGVQTQLTLTSVLLNEGDTTGSQVSSITFHFSDLVTLDASAFTLLRSDGTPVGLVLTTSVVNGKTVAVLTFTGSDLIDGALPDGSYTIVAHGNAIHNSQGQALGGAFTGDNAADFFGADGSGQGDLVSQFHPFP